MTKKQRFVSELEKSGFWCGRMVSWSKSTYCTKHPDHLVVFNANIVVESFGKIWHGDLDLTCDYRKLKNVARRIGEPIYVLYEMDARFGNENKPVRFFITKAVWNTAQEGVPKASKLCKNENN